MKYVLFFITAFVAFNQLQAQSPQFIAAGTIEFERKINLYYLYSSQPQLVDELKKINHQFKKQAFLLNFNNTTTNYKPATENPENFKFQKIPGENNIIYSDLHKNARLSQKSTFDKTYLIPDTIKKISWKLTGEKRTIAGFECRRANAIILDSIYVVAFFTEEILTKGGPESFCGLPGMILGVAIPELHITWFASKLSLKEPVIEKPSEGKRASFLEAKEIFKNEFKLYGDLGLWYYKYALL